MQEVIRLVNYYGGLRPFVEYVVLGWGYDYASVKAKGGVVNVPTCMISHHPGDVEVWEERIYDDEEKKVVAPDIRLRSNSRY